MPQATLLFYAVAVTLGVFIAGLWASIGIGGALLLFLIVWRIDGQIPRPNKGLIKLSILALLIMAILNLQSSQPSLSWNKWLELTTIFLPLSLFSCPSIQIRVLNRRFYVVVMMTALLGALSISIELFLNGPLLHGLKGPDISLTQYNRGLSYLVVMAFPLIAGVWSLFLETKDKKLVGLIALFIVVLFMAAGLTESRASKLALLLALMAMVTATFWPFFVRRLCEVILGACLSWAFIVQSIFLNHYNWLVSLPPSWRARMEIWDYMSYRILERPFWGWGLGTAHTLNFKEPHGAEYIYMTMPAAHPHNVVLELWVELGLPGVLLGLLFALLMLRKACDLDKKIAPFAIGAFVAALSLSLVAYDFWTDSLFACFALTGFAFSLLQRNETSL